MSSRGRLSRILAVTGMHGGPSGTTSDRELISILSLQTSLVGRTTVVAAVAVIVVDVVPCVVINALFSALRVCICTCMYSCVLLIHRTTICNVAAVAVVPGGAVAVTVTDTAACPSLLELIAVCHGRQEATIRVKRCADWLSEILQYRIILKH